MTSKEDLSKEIEKLRAIAERLGLPFLQHLLAMAAEEARRSLGRKTPH